MKEMKIDEKEQLQFWALLGVPRGTLHELWALDIAFIVPVCTQETETYRN